MDFTTDWSGPVLRIAYPFLRTCVQKSMLYIRAAIRSLRSGGWSKFKKFGRWWISAFRPVSQLNRTKPHQCLGDLEDSRLILIDAQAS